MADVSTPIEAARRDAPDRAPGRRGRATRRRLLDATAQLLETNTYRDLKVVDIAREAGTSPATFYQYFPDAESALLALADGLVGEGVERLTRPIREAVWEGRAAYEACEAISASFLDFWADHSALMAVIERKVAGEKPEPQARAEPTNITDLMAALEASVAAARTDRGSAKADEAEKPAAKATKRPRKAAAKQEEEPRQRRRKTA